MSRILITPLTSNIEPFVVEGVLTSKLVDGSLIYYIGDRSFPAEIVTVLEEERGKTE